MRLLQYYLPFSTFMLLYLIWMPDSFAQYKFEISATVDPLVIPVNLGTYIESGPGYYYINGRGMINQAGRISFSYWPFTGIGISIGAGLRNFKSQIDYTIPDPYDDQFEPIQTGSFPFSAKGWGPNFSLDFRQGRWRSKIGLAIYGLYDQLYTSSASTRYVIVFEEGGNVLAQVKIEENAYWNSYPQSYTFFQFEGQYAIIDNFFVKIGFETTAYHSHASSYALKASGFTVHTTPVEQPLNDYKMTSTLSSFSLGLGYYFGFGHYK